MVCLFIVVLFRSIFIPHHISQHACKSLVFLVVVLLLSILELLSLDLLRLLQLSSIPSIIVNMSLLF